MSLTKLIFTGIKQLGSTFNDCPFYIISFENGLNSEPTKHRQRFSSIDNAHTWATTQGFINYIIEDINSNF